MTVWDVLTWVTVAVLGPGVLVIGVAVARDLRRLLDAPATRRPPREPDL
jgi:hypothetical protein